MFFSHTSQEGKTKKKHAMSAGLDDEKDERPDLTCCKAGAINSTHIIASGLLVSLTMAFGTMVVARP